MSDGRPILTLGHSPDPDDAFMWWPVTGQTAGGGPTASAIDTGRFRFRAVPLDIETLNRRAAERGDLDVTALSARAYADVADRYVPTSSGASFGDGYGPKVVCRTESGIRRPDELGGARIAVPGVRTTAFLVLSLLMEKPFEFLEMPFDTIIGAVAAGTHRSRAVDAGLIIHEGQLTYSDSGLREVVDLGRWWKQHTGLLLPLGLNAVRRDLDARYGAGSVAEVAGTLARSVAHAMAHREEGLRYAHGFAVANEGGVAATPERVARFVAMYVNEWSADMGESGRQAIAELLARGSARGLCPFPGAVDVV